MSQPFIASIRARHPKATGGAKETTRVSEENTAIKLLFPHSYDIPALTNALENAYKPNGQKYAKGTKDNWVKVLCVYDLATDEELLELYRCFYTPASDPKSQMFHDAILNHLPKDVAASYIRQLLQPLKEWRDAYSKKKAKDAKSPEAKEETEAIRKEDWIHFSEIERMFNECKEKGSILFWGFIGAHMFSDKMLRADLCTARIDGQGNCTYQDGQFKVKVTNKTKRKNVVVTVRPDVRILLDKLVEWQKVQGSVYLFGYKDSDEMREKLIVPNLLHYFGKKPTINTLRSIKNTYMAQLWILDGSKGSTRDDYIAKPFDHNADEAYQTYIFEDLFDATLTRH
ncbi:hypothetical protein HK097_005450 [Rhizophlyctis rosea]|uniref:Uncharacterized protein n=1 Tax=Rhizophlyctis rosea TaxID=64517 RepID=A0AAD5WZI7_9FUNG|nr:hypothetical protein HK097_005450 [Rhizophlyctis rosea]